ncbi:hypothetical protein [Marinicella sp. W31]|uniref:hypothetical protein n=1 Tax=Marinicella sp. W31 TaxID=3023713 RepID=UPI00375829F6
MISRPHTETEIAEIIGKPVQTILAVPGSTPHSLSYFYIGFEGTYVRVFLDAGLLFVDDCAGPDKDEDLEPDSDYLDLTLMYKLTAQNITKAFLKNHVFRLLFESGTELRFKNNKTETIFQASRKS